MVLWEITLATAYFLGLKRTYRHALKIQRRVIVPKHSKTRQFVHRRTRAVFDVATKIHQRIQERDIKVGWNLGSSITRWIDQMKPSAQFRGGSPTSFASSSVRMTQHAARTSKHKVLGYYRQFKRASDTRFPFPSQQIWPKSFPTIARITRIVRPPNLAGTTTHYRRLSNNAHGVSETNYGVNSSGGVIRKDIMQWMLRN